MNRGREMAQVEKPIKGTLGYTVDGVYSVSVAEDPTKYYVRFAEGGFAQVYHRGRAAPIPNLPVEVSFDAGSLVILGSDPDRGGLFDGAHEIGPHSHARESGMEYPIDPRLLTPVKAVPLGGLVVEVRQGAYWNGAALRWWSGGSITLTAPASANQTGWTVIGLDPNSEALVAVNGATVLVSAALDPSTLAVAALQLAGAIPLAAIRLRNGQSALDETDFEDLRWPVGGRGSSLIVLREEQAQGTNGGTFTSGAWQTRALNVEASDSGQDASLSAHQITLAAGTYRLRASAPAFAVGAHQTRWQNVSDGVTTLIGTVEYADSVQTRSVVAGRFSIAASKTFELQQRCGTTRSSDGFGTAGNFAVEVYAEVELWRE